VTYSHFSDFISFDLPIRDSIIHSFLCALKSIGPEIYFLDTNFHRELATHGWTYAYHKYFLHESSSRYAKLTQFKPTLSAPVIVIPIHLNSFHWVVITKRIIGNRTYFLYADDLNSDNSYESLHNLYSSTLTSPSFHPAQSIWINCQSYTYLPHSNECGPRSLLAASIMALHPNPSSEMLLPFMHNNISQISRWWVAKSILISKVDPYPLQSLFHITPSYHHNMSHHRDSHPANLAPLSLSIHLSDDPIHSHDSNTITGNSSPRLLQFSSKHSEKNNRSINVQSEMISQETDHFTRDHNGNAQCNPCPNKTNVCSSQRNIKDWVIHQPFIPNVTSAQLPSRNQNSPFHPHQTFSAHLEPFGMPLPVIDHTKILQVPFRLKLRISSDHTPNKCTYLQPLVILEKTPCIPTKTW